MKQNTSILACFLLLSAAAHSTEQVYTWVDTEGTTHFSESPPAAAESEVQLIEVLPASGAGPADTADDNSFYSVVNQAERMQTRRLENEKLAAERKQAEAEASKARAEAQAALQNSYDNDAFNYYPAYPYYPRYRKHRPGYGYRPGYGDRPGHGGRPGYGDRPGHGGRPGSSRPGTPRTSLGKTPGMPHY